MWQADIYDFSASIFQHGNTFLPLGFNLFRCTIKAVLSRDTNTKAADITCKSCLKVWHSKISRCAVLRIIATHGLKHNGTIANCTSDCTCLIER